MPNDLNGNSDHYRSQSPTPYSLQMEFTEKQRLELGSLSSELNILILIVSIFLISPILMYGELIIKQSPLSPPP